MTSCDTHCIVREAVEQCSRPVENSVWEVSSVIGTGYMTYTTSFFLGSSCC